MHRGACRLFVYKVGSEECFNPLYALGGRNYNFLEGLEVGINRHPVVRHTGPKGSLCNTMLVLTHWNSLPLGLFILTQSFYSSSLLHLHFCGDFVRFVCLYQIPLVPET